MTSRKARRKQFGMFEVNLDSGELRRQGVRVRLQDQPFQLLVALLEDAGEVVTRDTLRDRLWPADTSLDFDHGLNTAINKLRRALGDSPDKPRFIETLSKHGYRFIAPVVATDDTLDLSGATAANLPIALVPTPAPVTLPFPTRPRRSNWLAPIAAAV